MHSMRKKIRIGILGCGAIGSRIAKSISKELKDFARLSALCDCDVKKARMLAKEFSTPRLEKVSLDALLDSCDLMVEAVNAKNTAHLIRQAIEARKDVLAMSVGKLLNAKSLFSLAAKNRCALLIPSGAIAGIDAIKSASLGQIASITLTTRKPASGFVDIPYIRERGIDLSCITEETVIFEGDVATAVKLFPQNINIAATLALASQAKSKMTVRIMTSPKYKTNSHEIEVVGDFGRIMSRTENEVCPDNPQTSYLAVLSGIQTLKDFCQGTRIGT